MPDMTSPDAQVAPDELVDTVLAASRALVAVAARSLAAAGDDVTLPQYRALVVLAARGPQERRMFGGYRHFTIRRGVQVRSIAAHRHAQACRNQ